MSDSSRPIDRASRITPTPSLEDRRRERAAVEQAATPPPEAASFDGIPGSPPDEVLAEVDAAMAQLEAMREAGTSVAFQTGAEGLRIELVDQDGARREIGAAELFDVASGRREAAADAPADEPAGGPGPHVDREA